jgi:hypothetical protein
LTVLLPWHARSPFLQQYSISAFAHCAPGSQQIDPHATAPWSQHVPDALSAQCLPGSQQVDPHWYDGLH